MQGLRDSVRDRVAALGWLDSDAGRGATHANLPSDLFIVTLQVAGTSAGIDGLGREADGSTDPLARRLPAALGAFSSASWVFASFVGVARPLSGVLSFADFMGLYALGVGFAVRTLALLAWRARGSVQSNPAPGLDAPT